MINWQTYTDYDPIGDCCSSNRNADWWKRQQLKIKRAVKRCNVQRPGHETNHTGEQVVEICITQTTRVVKTETIKAKIMTRRTAGMTDEEAMRFAALDIQAMPGNGGLNKGERREYELLRIKGGGC